MDELVSCSKMFQMLTLEVVRIIGLLQGCLSRLDSDVVRQLLHLA